ncbi:MAG: electron transfer flavoprotein subunit beta/FixA family protein [Nitrososphaerota archaeon]
MNIVVCVKHVPDVSEIEVKVDPVKKDIDKSGLVFDINEWDDYAVEEALRIKEKFGGTVTVVTIGDESADSTLRKCLAKGADNAIRVTDPRIASWDPLVVAKILYKVVKDIHYDLILTGVQASDDGYSVVGQALAEMLGIPHATLVKKIEIDGGTVRVNRELEGGLEEIIELSLPALLTIQTGINEPRYVSIMGVRKAMRKEIKILNLDDLGLAREAVKEASPIEMVELYVPPVERKAEIITGSVDEVASKIVEIIKSRGLV